MRDDRFVVALDLGAESYDRYYSQWVENEDRDRDAEAKAGRFHVAYVARAVTPGDFFLPAPEVRDMYRPTVNGRGSGGRTVIAAGS